MKTMNTDKIGVIACEDFAKACLRTGLKYFSGVPDSTYASWLSYLVAHPDQFQHRIAANEGAAIAHAAGYYLATGNVGVAYMQNSGFGNTVNPLTSLTDENAFAIPMLLMIGWRGEPGFSDEPQHKKMGQAILQVLKTLEIPHAILTSEQFNDQLENAKESAIKNSRPHALIVKKGLFEKPVKSCPENLVSEIDKQKAILEILKHMNQNDIIVATTGKISRELYEIRESTNAGHGNDFYMVGSMGHASAIALEIASQKPNARTFVFDGDGAVIMHLGSMGTIGHYHPKNLVHVIFDNQCHESTGEQPTVSNTMDFQKIAQGCGYQHVDCCRTQKELAKSVSELKRGLTMIVVKIGGWSRDDLGRPKHTPRELKEQLMKKLKDLN